VFFGNVAAPLLYVQSQQINAVAPFEIAGGASTNLRVEYNGALIGSGVLSVNGADPGIFRLHGGYSDQAAALNQDGTVNGPTNPAATGSVVALFGTGFGLADLPLVTGGISPLVASQYQANVNVSIEEVLGGASVPADVLYAGIAPGQLAGVGQIHIRIPAVPVPTGGAAQVYVQVGVYYYGSNAESTIYVK
jgi:uncharacterized protein (TIGR03437 family)